ncbi:MAG: LemA family protein [Proteobacteria bacterium]|uniref:LemA family protein n=1 Tax=hydrothermal vent metagenome TaxID=652676 RepID=A0A3B0W7X8_9ZZZZ|nr:LemA family protein [Pseudomonadota bacterium]
MSQGVKTILVIIGAIAVLVAGSVLWGIGQYNKIVRMDEQVNAQWAQVENQLKRRFDLIPNLVETTKGYAKHEKDLFENIANARTKYFQANRRSDKIRAAGDFERALSRIMMLQERYPQLKANESFLKLQDSLEGTENRIAVERKRYNDAVRAVNTYRRTVVGRFFAALAGVEKAQYFKPPAAETKVPQVKF